MPVTPFSAELLWAVMNRLPDGISVLREREGSQAREIVLENSQAAAFRAAGRDAPCIKILEEELPSDLPIFSGQEDGPHRAGGGDVLLSDGASSSSGRCKLFLQVHSNPATSAILKGALEAVSDLCFLGDPRTGTLTFVNSSRLQWSAADWHRSDNGLESWSRLLHPEDREETLAAWHDAVTTGKLFDREYRLRKQEEGGRPEEVTWMRAKGGHIFNCFGRPILLAVIVTDHTDAARYREALERKSSFMTTALGAVPLSVVIAEKNSSDHHHPLVFTNKETARILRIDPSRALKSVEELSSFFKLKDWAKLEEQDLPIARSLVTGEVVSGQEFLLYREDSSPGVARMSSAPVRDPSSGTIIGAVGVAEDVSDKIVSEREKVARQAAEQAAEHMRHMVASVSHEVRTPIAGITGLASALSDTALDGEQQELVDGIRESAQLLLVVVNDLLDHSKVVAGKMELEMKPFMIRQAVDYVLKLVEQLARDKNLRLITHFDSRLPQAVIHSEVRFKQVLLNLLSNAVKFTPRGGSITLGGTGQSDKSPGVAPVPTQDSWTFATGTGIVRAAGQLPLTIAPKVAEASPEALLRPFQPGSVISSAITVTTVASTPSSRQATANARESAAAIEKERLIEIKAHATELEAAVGFAHPGSWMRLHFSVRDSGIGLTPGQIARLFQPFSQADSSTASRYGGTGLGLALCRDLLKLMGGDIRVESEGEGKGCVFQFHFLAQVADPAAVAARELLSEPAGAVLAPMPTAGVPTPPPSQKLSVQRPQGRHQLKGAGRRDISRAVHDSDSPLTGLSFVSAASPDEEFYRMVLNSRRGLRATTADEESQQPRLLVVDDNAINRMVTYRYLQKLGYTDIHVASNGAEAVDMVETSIQGFDLIFCDLVMPVMGGIDAAAAIRALSDSHRKAVPIVAMSVDPDEEDRLQHTGLFSDWLPKPFDIKELRAVMDRCLHTGTPA